MIKEEEPIKWLGGNFYFDFQTRESRLTPMETCLNHLAGKEGIRILEIGSCEGQSSLWFIRTLLTAEDSKIVCIDPHVETSWYNDPESCKIRRGTNKKTGEVFKSNILDKYPDKVIYYREKAWDVLEGLEKKYFDLIYVDGEHNLAQCYMDGKLAWPLLKDDGIIMFDDFFANDKNGVSRAVNMLKEDKIITDTEVLHNKDILILRRR
jgi:predicted O-methyltransferase YrrM